MDTSKLKKPFGEWAKSAQSRLTYEYQASRSVLTQGTLLGIIREAVVKDILRKFLPNSIEIGSGQIFDSQGVSSKQIDIVLAENSAPVFRYEGGVSAYLLETVTATIEVKSMMHRDKLHESLDNCNSVKDLAYGLHIKGKGKKIFEEAVRWVEGKGALQTIDEAILNPRDDRNLDCPENIWEIIRFVQFWLHWATGDLGTPEFYDKFKPIIETGDFDFFVNLLQHVLNQTDQVKAVTVDTARASDIQHEFFQQLHNSLMYECLPPTTFILAYGGYKKLDIMVLEVKRWYEKNMSKISWAHMPRVIMNDRMLMYRHFNTYHCNVFDYPIIFLMVGLCNTFSKLLSLDRPLGSRSQITPYFDLSRILGDLHPKNVQPYLTWSIPLDNNSSGEIETVK